MFVFGALAAAFLVQRLLVPDEDLVPSPPGERPALALPWTVEDADPAVPGSAPEASRVATTVAAVPAAEAEDPGGGTSARRPRNTERDQYLAFLALARSDLGRLEGMAAEILDGPTPQARRMAWLRALYDAGSSRAPEFFGRAIRTIPDRGAAQGESLPSVLVHYLGSRASRDPRARSLLEETAFERTGPQPVPPQVRRRAAALLAMAATPKELAALPYHLAREIDAELVAGCLSAVASNPNREAADSVFVAMGRTPVRHEPVPETDR
ncbi:MAG: hypothetical protein IT458_15260 [Planctomycetes bacterium]|nr:hypothetical protein [Planctomycetota bacterium]